MRKNPARKSAKKSGGPTIKIREKSVLPKPDPNNSWVQKFEIGEERRQFWVWILAGNLGGGGPEALDSWRNKGEKFAEKKSLERSAERFAGNFPKSRRAKSKVHRSARPCFNTYCTDSIAISPLASSRNLSSHVKVYRVICWLRPKAVNQAKNALCRPIFALPSWLWNVEELVALGPEMAPIGPNQPGKGPIFLGWFLPDAPRCEPPLRFSQNLPCFSLVISTVIYLGNENSARSFLTEVKKKNPGAMDVRTFGSWMSALKCLFFSRIWRAWPKFLPPDVRRDIRVDVRGISGPKTYSLGCFFLPDYWAGTLQPLSAPTLFETFRKTPKSRGVLHHLLGSALHNCPQRSHALLLGVLQP